MTVPNLIVYKTLLYIKSSNLILNDNIHNYNTRRRGDIHQTYQNNRLSNIAIFCIGIKIWNKLPLTVRLYKQSIFKSKLREVLINSPKYSVNEIVNYNSHQWEKYFNVV